MIYSISSIIVGIATLFFVFKLRIRDKNMWDTSTTIKGFVGGIILIVLGIITLFKGW